MKRVFDLTELEWKLSGWHPHYWRGRVSMELGMKLDPDIPSLPAAVPGSVQGALRDAGLLPDWNFGLESRGCEWVENRHWAFETVLPAAWTREGKRKVLRCEGLDYQGVVLVNGREAGRFCGTFVPQIFDLTGLLEEGENRLTVLFTGHPDFLGQIGWTSRIAEWKARFNYMWDWVVRLVQIGIWEGVYLEADEGDGIGQLGAYADFDPQEKSGSVCVETRLELDRGKRVEVEVAGEGGVVRRWEAAAEEEMEIRLEGLEVEPWNPNGNGERACYELQVRLLDGEGNLLDRQSRPIGFRRVEWRPCAGASEDALPWICRVNGRDTFLQGFNWVPIRPFFADVDEGQYRRLLETYRDLGTNILRVWGGAVLERECFYRLCDELGIMVWQEFPLSSSGIDNWPPEDEAAIEGMEEIAASYVRRRQHHPSLIIWCGGNELQGDLQGSRRGAGKPVDDSHPMMAAQKRVVERLDPTRRYLPTSSTGPRFTASAEEFGKGLHHDVHGPWNHAGPLDSWRAYWDGDDALLRSETGMPGAEPAALIRKYGGHLAWPADKRTNPWYRHCAAWWDQWQEYLNAGGDAGSLDAYVAWSQRRQAEALEYVARRCKGRFPTIGGILFWMGHDCFPCPVNTAVIDFEGRPKPAGEAIGRVFRGEG